MTYEQKQMRSIRKKQQKQKNSQEKYEKDLYIQDLLKNKREIMEKEYLSDVEKENLKRLLHEISAYTNQYYPDLYLL